MKARMTSQPVRAALAVVFLIAAAWIFRAFLLTFLIEPIGWLLWAGWRLVASVDRGLIWLSLIIACSLLIIRLVPPDVVGREDDHDESPPSRAFGDRLEHWRTWAARSTTDAAGRSAFHLRLESMAAAAGEATRRPLPPPLDVQDHELRGQAGIARLGASIARMVPDHRRRQDARRVDDLLNWMESILEIKHEQ